MKERESESESESESGSEGESQSKSESKSESENETLVLSHSTSCVNLHRLHIQSLVQPLFPPKPIKFLAQGQGLMPPSACWGGAGGAAGLARDASSVCHFFFFLIPLQPRVE